MSRQKLKYIFLDCPSYHEVEGAIVTEADTLRALLINQQYGSVTREPFRCATEEALAKLRTRQYRLDGATHVHVGAHGSPTGLGLIDGEVEWVDVARTLKKLVGRRERSTRLLCMSFCHGEDAWKAMNARTLAMHTHYSGCLFFKDDEHPEPEDDHDVHEIGFGAALTAWSMFYLKTTQGVSRRDAVKAVNAFFGRSLLRYKRFSGPKKAKAAKATRRRRRTA